MDEDRIKRIARALCRAARLDPDAPSAVALPSAGQMIGPVPPSPPVWTMFKAEAERFARQHGSVAAAL